MANYTCCGNPMGRMGVCPTCHKPGPDWAAEQERRALSSAGNPDVRRDAQDRDHREIYGDAPHPADDLAEVDKHADEGAPSGPVELDPTNQATLLVQLARKHFRLLRSEDGQPYAVDLNGPNIAIELGRDGDFAGRLVRLFVESEGKAPSDNAERMAIKILAAYLRDSDPEPVHLRSAVHEGAMILDLGTPDGHCVTVGAGGWTMLDRSPVLFRRDVGFPLPVPARTARGDGLDRLRALLHCDEALFRLVCAWLAIVLVPGVPHPILVLRGEQGTSKTTFASIVQRVIDPSALAPGALPDTQRDFAVRMNAAYVQAFDNVTKIPQWMSDALCRAATGDVFAARTLYSNRGLTVLRYTRAVILTTIEPGALSGDLVERMLPADLDRIPAGGRKTERAVIGEDKDKKPGIYDLLDKHHAVILGAILDLLSGVFRNIGGVELDNLPRMADFGKMLAALDKAQGWQTYDHYLTLTENETGALLEQYPFGVAIKEFMDGRDDEWRGTATELRKELTSRLPDSQRPPNRLPDGWPADATRAGGQLRRIGPILRTHGIETRLDKQGRQKTKLWSLRKTASAASAASAPPSDLLELADANEALASAPESADAARTLVSVRADASADTSVRTVTAGQPTENDAADAADAKTSATLKDDPTATAAHDDSWVRDAPDDLDDDSEPAFDEWPEGSAGAAVNPNRGPQPRRTTRAKRHGGGGRR
jgi:hypothetical protein